MDEGDQQPNAERRQNHTIIWVVAGLIALCACAAGVVVVAGAIGVLGYLGIASRTTTIQPQPLGPLPTANATPARITFDVPVESRDHVPEGTVIHYNSNPPSSGEHYAIPQGPGMYTDAVLDGYVVHSMEHGYVVIWYDCSALANDACRGLQKDIGDLIAAYPIDKLIGMPRAGMGHTIGLTSWGKLAFLDTFDADFINTFIDDNMNHAPENIP